MKVHSCLVAVIVAACSPAPLPEQPKPAPPQTSATVAVVAPPPSDDAAIARAGQDYVDLIVKISPETATQLGLHQRDEDLDDRTLAGFERDTALEEKMLADLQTKFASPHASRPALTDLAIIEHALAVDVKMKRSQDPLRRKPDSYMGPMNALFLMTAREYAPAAVRAKNAVARIEKIPAQLEEAKKNLGKPPKVWTQVGIEAAGGAKQFFDDEKKPLEDALPGDKDRVEAALKNAKKAYADYKQFLEKTVLPRGGDDYAAGSELFNQNSLGGVRVNFQIPFKLSTAFDTPWTCTGRGTS